MGDGPARRARAMSEADDEIDPRFREAKRRAAARKRKRNLSRIAIPVVLVVALGTVAFLTRDQWSFGPVEVTEESLDNNLTATTLDLDLQAAANFSAAFVDLAGDPMRIRFAEEGDDIAIREVITPSALVQPARVTPKLTLVSDVMVSAEERFITTLPSSQDDFAVFNLRKSGAPADAAAAPAQAAPQAAAPSESDMADIGADYEAGVEITRQAVEDTTSRVSVLPQSARPPAPRDIFVRISAPQPLQELLRTKGIAAQDLEAVTQAAQTHLGRDTLEEGNVVALRGQDVPGEGFRFLQLSVYASDAYFGSLARADDGGVGPASDPWVEDDLFDYTGTEQAEGGQEIRYRMMDAFYSTAIRNRVPSALVGEAIALLSGSHDLEAFAAPGDRMVMLYAKDRLEDDTGAGQILYIALQGADVAIECFVFRERPGGDYRCYGATPELSNRGGGGARPGMVTPVNGVLTSRFGPRNHPILKEVRLHAGVDWAAPIGTPVLAAFGGTVVGAGVAGGYGNLIRIAHPDGTETRYAHLDTMAVGAGAQVRAGETIGAVGTTGRSTGPHLHFELHENGAPIDPFGGGGAGAVDQLVARIVQVESAGVADAKNPLSTATGLGQFIESTWIRMIAQYRPDLSDSLSRAELLELRKDPTLSREMVANLAREGEAYLRARGHHITAGRLYLCHFLGAKGADLVLKAQDEDMLLEVLGQAVISANPFLTGKNVAYIKEWAERKMRGSAGTRVAVAEPGGLPDYRRALKALLGTG